MYTFNEYSYKDRANMESRLKSPFDQWEETEEKSRPHRSTQKKKESILHSSTMSPQIFT